MQSGLHAVFILDELLILPHIVDYVLSGAGQDVKKTGAW
jgi:hypothetical protein